MTDIDSAFYNYDETVEKSKTSYSGLLGLAINGNRIVNHPTRAGYVYVRLRDNLSEVVQAFNDKVSPVYDFPVLIQRKGNRWYVLGRDDLRYESWGTSAPYLPRHGDQHSFNRDGGGGGDVAWVYPDQFMPLLVYPSGTYGASNLLIAPYVLQKSDKFIYVGNTGTTNIARYKPTTSSAIMGLVYLDRETGNPGFLINSGTPFAGTITGTNAVVPYLPYPSATQEPLYAFRLVSGTTSLTWSNLYNVRQFIGGSTSTGTSTSNHEALSGLLGGSVNNHYHLTPSQIIGLVSGTSTTLHQHSGTSPAGSTNAVQINGGGVFSADDEFEYTVGGQVITFGRKAGAEASHEFQWPVSGVDGVSFHNLTSWGTGYYSSIRGTMARGTKASPTAAQADDIAMRFRGAAYSGVGLVANTATGAEIRFVANENQSATNHGMRAEIWTTPDGSTTETKVFTIGANGQVAVLSTTDSTSYVTGALLVSGGVGIAKSVSINGNVGIGQAASASAGLFLLRTVTDTSGGVFGLNGGVFSNPASASSATVTGAQVTARTAVANAQNHTGTIAGGLFTAFHRGSGTATALVAGRFSLTNDGGGTVTDAITLSVLSVTNSSGTITNNYGLLINNQTAGATLNYAIYTGTGLVRFGDAVSSTGSILSSNATTGVGYTTGAGGTVTQATNKATGVTLNKVTGLITMNNAALAADTTVTFTLTNSAIAATDTIILNHASAGTAGAYTLNAQVAAGSATINVRNVTAGSLSEAIVIRYTVIKSVSA